MDAAGTAVSYPRAGVRPARRADAGSVRLGEGFALAPVHDWEAAWHQVQAGNLLRAFALTAPLAVPAGLAAAAGLSARRIYKVESGLSGRTVSAPVVFGARQWRRASRAARGRVAAPGAFPLADRRGQVVIGALPYTLLGSHQVVIGATGCGKPNLMMRTWAGWHAAALCGDDFSSDAPDN
jgi:hypothetical protein